MQFTAGFDQQIGENLQLGLQYVYKDTKNLIGWEILDGVYETVPFEDPFTGTQYNLLNEIEKPTIPQGQPSGEFARCRGLSPTSRTITVPP